LDNNNVWALITLMSYAHPLMTNITGIRFMLLFVLPSNQKPIDYTLT